MSSVYTLVFAVALLMCCGCNDKAPTATQTSSSNVKAADELSTSQIASQNSGSDIQAMKTSWSQFYPAIEQSLVKYSQEKKRTATILNVDIAKTESLINPFKATVVVDSKNQAGAMKYTFYYGYEAPKWKLLEGTYAVMSSNNPDDRNDIGVTKALDLNRSKENGWLIQHYVPR